MEQLIFDEEILPFRIRCTRNFFHSYAIECGLLRRSIDYKSLDTLNTCTDALLYESKTKHANRECKCFMI